VTIEVTEPFVLDAPADGELVISSPTFIWQPLSDLGGGSVTYQLYIDAQRIGLPVDGTSVTAPEVAPGAHSWQVEALDSVGHSSFSESRAFKVEGRPPLSFALSSPEDEACSQLVTPELCWRLTTDGESEVTRYTIVIDDVSSADVEAVDIVTGASEQCSTPGSPLAEGSHTWKVVATDAASLTTTSIDTRTIFVDPNPLTPPALSAPEDGATLVDQLPTFEWSAASASRLDYYLLSIDFGTYVFELPPDTLTLEMAYYLEYGEHQWSVTAFDQCGREATSSRGSFSLLECVSGTTQQCEGNAVGPCNPGTRTCIDDTWSSCEGAVYPDYEYCDATDNDCDGEVDEGHALGESCTTGLGACERTGAFVCSADTYYAECSAQPGDPSPETCNGIDDDCNGWVDDEFYGLGDECFVGLGQCFRAGVQQCSTDGTAVECSMTAGTPTTELCNNWLDDDCDGESDEWDCQETTGAGGSSGGEDVPGGAGGSGAAGGTAGAAGDEGSSNLPGGEAGAGASGGSGSGPAHPAENPAVESPDGEAPATNVDVSAGGEPDEGCSCRAAGSDPASPLTSLAWLGLGAIVVGARRAKARPLPRRPQA
jgi:MYXO-CTERM domain-containing protein